MLIDTIRALQCQRMILIVGTRLKKMQLDRLQNLERDIGVRIENFAQEELVFNVTKHHLVPPHRILSPEDKAKVLA